MAIVYHKGNTVVTIFQYSTVGRIISEDKKFRGFRGYLVNLENKYPRKFRVSNENRVMLLFCCFC